MTDESMRKIQVFLAACAAFPALMVWLNERIDAYKERRRNQQQALRAKRRRSAT